MPLNLKSIFETGKEKVIGAIGKAIDDTFTNKEEKMIQAGKALDELRDDILKEYELEIQDRSSARARETEFVKATGHIDYLMWFLAIAGVGIFAYMVYAVLNNTIPEASRELVFHIFGLVEGAMLVNIYNYYFGSSAGSRIKDMKK